MPRSSIFNFEPTNSESDRTRSGLTALTVLAALACATLIPLEPLTENPAGERVAYHHEIHQLDPRWVADAGPHSRHASNGQGLRGDVIVGRDLEIIVLGGSTVECSLLDEPDTLVAKLGAETQPVFEQPVRAAALAQAGLPLSGLLTELETFSESRQPTLLVGMFGANEAQAFFNHAPWVATTPNGHPDVWIDPASPFGVTGRAETYRGWYRPGNQGRFLAAPRAAYADRLGWVEQLHPAHVRPLQQSLAEYVVSLAALAQLGEDRGASLLLVTQPLAPWAEPADGHGWAPFIYAGEGEGFVPGPELTRSLVEAFNTQTRGFANDRGLALVDLAAQLDGCTACFYDQWHFTNTGASLAAAAIAEAVIPVLESTQ